uniref:Sphingomyelinase n=1 Tax=Rhipicephalus appendiculatus TaxID=34631 RepID=A0A131YDR6_RHIAP
MKLLFLFCHDHINMSRLMKFTCLTTSLIITMLLFPAKGTQVSNEIPQMPSGNRARLRPFYIIGHMANTLREVDSFLDDGANAIEADIEFAKNGTVLGTHHGLFACDCFRVCGKRTNIRMFLKYIRDITSNSSARYAAKMTVLQLDLKTAQLPAQSKLAAGFTLAESLVKHLWHGVHEDYLMNVVLSIDHAQDKDVLTGTIRYLKKNKYHYLLRYVGYDVHLNDDLSKIKVMYQKLGITGHRWQGDGLTNCFRFLIPHKRLYEAIRIRDSPSGYIEKVYYWTVDLPAHIEKAIRTTIDGIITNKPANVFYVVKTKFADELRIADRSDNPWKRFQNPQEGTTKQLGNDDVLDENFIKGRLPK